MNGIMHGTVLYTDDYLWIIQLCEVLNHAKELVHFFVLSWKVISLDEQTYMWALKQADRTEQRERKNNVSSCYPPSRKDLVLSCSNSSVDFCLFFYFIL